MQCLSCPPFRNRSSTFFFFNDTATTEIYTLSLHDALPISRRCYPQRGIGWRVRSRQAASVEDVAGAESEPDRSMRSVDRKSTRLNSSHQIISYAVFCLKKKKSPNRRDQHHLNHYDTLLPHT